MSTAASPYGQTSILPPRGLLLALLAQAPLVAAHWPLAPSLVEAISGGVLVIAGAALNVGSARLFERKSVGICPFSSAPVLVTTGPFALSRHPMYVGLVALSAGLTLLTGVLANVWISVAFAIWLHHSYVLPEERFLRDRFGAAYDAYAERVPRWLPVGALRLRFRKEPSQ
jgi:protein-S-isoprenylcysteine O-methyltransferase Ste14